MSDTPQEKLMQAIEESPIMSMMAELGFSKRKNYYNSWKTYHEMGVDEEIMRKHFNVGPIIMPELPDFVVRHLRDHDIEMNHFMDSTLYCNGKGATICYYKFMPDCMNEPNYFNFSCSDATIRKKFENEVRKIQYRIKKANTWKEEQYAAYINTKEGSLEHARDLVHDAWQHIQREVIPYQYESLTEITGGGTKEYVAYSREDRKLLRFGYDFWDACDIFFFAEDTELHDAMAEALKPTMEAIAVYEQAVLYDKIKGK